MFSRAFQPQRRSSSNDNHRLSQTNQPKYNNPSSPPIQSSSPDAEFERFFANYIDRNSDERNSTLHRSESFSSIISLQARIQFSEALNNLHQSSGMDPHEHHQQEYSNFETNQHHIDRGDLLVDFDQQPSGTGSSHGSTDSTNGFEKLDHHDDVLAEYGQRLADQLLFNSERTPSDELSPSSPPDMMDNEHIVVPHPAQPFQQADTHHHEHQYDVDVDSSDHTLPPPYSAEQDDIELPKLSANHGFETEPRPPTPPKDPSGSPSALFTSPPLLDLGPPSHHKLTALDAATPPHETKHPRSILKPAEGNRGPWFDFKSVDHRVLDLIYWRDPKKSAVVLALTLLVLLLLASFSLITVIAYVGLTLLAVTLSYRIYKTILAQVQKTDSANPFKPYLEHDLTLPQDRVHQQVDVFIEHAQHVVSQLRRLFLVEDVFDTVKFGLLLWALTYIGAWFSSLTLIILVVLGVFSVPKFYEVYKEPIDKNLAVVREHVKKITDVVQDKLPFLKKKQN